MEPSSVGLRADFANVMPRSNLGVARRNRQRRFSSRSFCFGSRGHTTRATAARVGGITVERSVGYAPRAPGMVVASGRGRGHHHVHVRSQATPRRGCADLRDGDRHGRRSCGRLL